MRVLVTGGTGNVGLRLVERLVQDPAVDRVLAVSRRRPDRLPDGVAWRQVVLPDSLPDDLLDGIDGVVHLAWLFQPSRRPATTWASNVDGTIRLLEAVERSEVRVLVHASSVGAYIARRDDIRVDETWPTHGIPTAAYSREKAYVERLLDLFEEHHPDTRVVRLRKAFILRREAAVQQRRLFGGPFAPGRTVARFGVPWLPDPGGLRFQTVHTDDVVEAYRLALVREVRGAFNIAANPPLDMEAVGRLLGARVRRVPAGVARGAVHAAWAAHLVPVSPGMFDLFSQVPLLDTTRARSELGWSATLDPRATFEELMAGLRSGQGAPTPPLDPATSGPLRIHEFATGIGREP